MFSRFFIDRPIFATVLSVVITLGGGIAYYGLPLTQYPPVTPPQVFVRCTYPGASADVVAQSVAAPIEQQVNGVENMIYMESSSANDGSYSLSVTFRQGVDLNLAQVLVQNQVNLALPMLPDELKRTGVTTRKWSPDMLMSVNIYSPHGRYDQLYLSNYALMRLRDELLRLPGVSDVNVMGQRDYSMRIWVDPDKLAARSLTAGDVVNAIREQNVQVASGQIGQEPVRPGQETQITLSTLGRLDKPEQFANIILRTMPDGAITRLRDVGRVELGARNEDVSCKLDGYPSAGLFIVQLPDANALDVAERVRAKMDELAKDFPDDLTYGILFDTTPYTQECKDEVFKALRDSVLLVALVVLLVPAELAVGGHSPDCRAGGHRRHFRRHGGAGLQPEQSHALRAGAGHRHRGRQCDRGGRGGGALHRAGTAAPRGDDQGHGPALRPGDRRGAGPQRGLRPLRVH